MKIRIGGCSTLPEICDKGKSAKGRQEGRTATTYVRIGPFLSVVSVRDG